MGQHLSLSTSPSLQCCCNNIMKEERMMSVGLSSLGKGWCKKKVVNKKNKNHFLLWGKQVFSQLQLTILSRKLIKRKFLGWDYWGWNMLFDFTHLHFWIFQKVPDALLQNTKPKMWLFQLSTFSSWSRYRSSHMMLWQSTSQKDRNQTERSLHNNKFNFLHKIGIFSS